MDYLYQIVYIIKNYIIIFLNNAFLLKSIPLPIPSILQLNVG